MKQPHLSKVLLLLLVTAFLGLLVFTGCETEKEVIKTEEVIVHDTITVNIISVDSIFATPDSVTQGKSIMLTADVTTQPEAGALTFKWFAEAGSFDNAEGDTVSWTAPDSAGVYVVSVHATDGEFIGIGSRMVGVDMFAPTVTPYYVSDAACSQCHPGMHDDWEMTGHAEAWAGLMTSSHAGPSCFPCHAVGYEPQPNTGNSGHDEAPIDKFVDVQCENCHGPGSDHADGPSPANITVDWDALVCGKCHDGEHHPYYTEWQDSPHGFDPATSAHGAPANSFCQGCHEGVAAAYRLSGDVSSFYGGGSISERPDTTEVPLGPVVCQTCHDPHSEDNPGQLRTVADVPLVTANGESPIVTEGGVGRLCMHCHHARRAPEPQIQEGYAHFGPHANPQGDMMKGASAYHGVADPSFVWAGPSHLNVQNSCKTCHIHQHEFGGTGEPAVTGHLFLPDVEACVQCHGPITDFDEIMALEDFDGDGNVEGVQSEVQGLIHLLEDALIADGLDTTGVGFAGALGDTTMSTFQQREAGYNLIFIEDDKSMGVHNPDYAVQLLQQSILYIGGTLPTNAKIVRYDNEVVGMW